MQLKSYITSSKIKPTLLFITGSRYNRYRYNHIRAPTRPYFSTKSTRYIRLLVITGLVIYDFYCILVILNRDLCSATPMEISRRDLLNYSLNIGRSILKKILKYALPPFYIHTQNRQEHPQTNRCIVCAMHSKPCLCIDLTMGVNVVIVTRSHPVIFFW